jgi:adenylosuccinate synthase
MKASVVIGASFGDEGKGLVTDYLSSLEPNSIVVCHNGGPQRGHTVVLPNNVKHVFHHFGSGTLNGVPTYFSSEFMVNPILFREEYEKLEKMVPMPKIYIDRKCKITLFHDMLFNQIIEIERMKSKENHGSCGIGILETVVRNKHKDYIFDIVKSKNYKTFEDFKKLTYWVRDYYLWWRGPEFKELIPEERLQYFIDTISDERIMSHYFEDLCWMFDHTEIVANKSFLNHFNHCIFESGQGLLLDQNNEEYYPNLTPSHTGSTNPLELLTGLDVSDVELYYVTRPYITRHGAGLLHNVVDIKSINAKPDTTNIDNNFQGSIRYGYLSMPIILQGIIQDMQMWKRYNVLVTPKIVITHLDETDINGKIDIIVKETPTKVTRDELIHYFAELGFKVCGSFGPTKQDFYGDLTEHNFSK